MRDTKVFLSSYLDVQGFTELIIYSMSKCGEQKLNFSDLGKKLYGYKKNPNYAKLFTAISAKEEKKELDLSSCFTYAIRNMGLQDSQGIINISNEYNRLGFCINNCHYDETITLFEQLASNYVCMK